MTVGSLGYKENQCSNSHILLDDAVRHYNLDDEKYDEVSKHLVSGDMPILNWRCNSKHGYIM